ncbi:MAG: hypothetical protein KAY32_13390 [Candidatus Eisenbacteria sp.]|nr:hypothetical protein [Candidatus Eisenbacteria bacterium]
MLRHHAWFVVLLLAGGAVAGADTGVHTTYLWHMHQPIYWPAASSWMPGRYETAYETITLGHSENDVFTIFNKDDRVGDYQWYPRAAIASVLDLPDAGAQVSFAGALIENVFSLGDNGWNGGRYASDWYADYREARGWSTGTGDPRLEPVLVGFHHGISALMDAAAVRMELACAREIYADAWGDTDYSVGFFPAEMCFSERLIPLLVEAGIEWSIVADLHIGRCCVGYPYQANEDNCDPPNAADQVNPAQSNWTSHYISRGVTLKIPYPFGFTPHRAEYVDPASGEVDQIIVVPAASAMGWEEGYGLFGTGGIDAIAWANDPSRPMLALFAHDGDNAWSGGYSYYYENIGQFCHQAATAGYRPTTVATYLAEHPVPTDDVVHVEDGGWVNADGDFGSPQFINWNWPLVDAGGAFDIPAGWAEDERNWAVLTAAQNRVETAADIAGAIDAARVVDPLSGASGAEQAWHFLLAGYESGYMYYGTALDMEVKATLACNRAVTAADPLIAGGADTTAPTVWLPQRLPWNPGGYGGGSLWGYPGGVGLAQPSDFYVWTFAYDVSGLARVELMIREDLDGWNDPESHDNETYVGGAEVGAWQAWPLGQRSFPLDEPWEMPGVDFFVLPDYIADEYWTQVTGFSDVLLDYYIEAEDATGRIKRTPLQHVYVGAGGTAGFIMDGELDGEAALLADGDGLSLWARREGDLLYLATEGTPATASSDHFLLVFTDPSGTRGAPWAKAGQSPAWDYFLGAEDDNGWHGWFDAGEAVQNGAEFDHAQGSVLEGTLDLAALYGGSPPDELWLAAVAYATPDGGALTAQAPQGDGDGDLEAPELALLATSAAITAGRPGASLQLALGQTIFAERLEFTVFSARAEEVRLEILDVSGRRVRLVHTGPLPRGRSALSWDGRDAAGAVAPSGVYYVRASGAAGEISRRAVRLR